MRTHLREPGIGRKITLEAPRVVELRHKTDVSERDLRAEEMLAVAGPPRCLALEPLQARREPVPIPGVHRGIALRHRPAQIVEHPQVVERMDIACNRKGE